MKPTGSLLRTVCAAAGLLLLIAFVSTSQGLSSTSARADELPAALPVALVVAERSDGYEVSEKHAGRIVARRSSDLGFERGGRLVEVLVDEGERVEQGALLAKLETRELRARRRELLAQRDQIDADRALARSTAERRQRLFDSGVVSSQRLDEAAFAESSLDARSSAARASIDAIDIQLELSEIRAPFAGAVAGRFADEGTVLQPGAPVLRLLEDRALEAHIGLPPEVASSLEVGRVFAIDVEGRSVAGRLRVVLPEVDARTRTRSVIFELEGPRRGVQHGALARVAIDSQVPADGYWLPIDALAEGRRGTWTAYAAVEEEGGLVAERRQLEVIHAEANRAFVRGTIEAGDRIVSTGVHRIVPGMRVRATSGG